MVFDELRLRYPEGKMIINMNCFFPASAPNIRKLYKTILISDEDPADLVDRILEHFDKRNIEMERMARKAVNDYMDHKTAYEEKRNQYKAGKRANGVPIRKDERPEWRKKLQEMDEQWKADKKLYDVTKRQQKRLSQNRLLLLTLNGRC